MSTVGVSMCKDEADIVGYVTRHMAEQVDHLIVSDNGSTDGTREMLAELERELPLTVLDDPDPAYFQSAKMSRLAALGLERGFQWVVPYDHDEFWYSGDGRTVAQQLAGHAPDVQIVEAVLYHHIPSALDDAAEANPFRRIGWRKRERAGLGKVACRTRPDLVIEAGNHSARTDGTATRAGGLTIRHYSWRSEAQYLAKIRNGAAAYAATSGLPETTGLHWRMWEGKTDDQILEHFRTWFWTADPAADDSLTFDPAPVAPLPPPDAPEFDPADRFADARPS